ncbi:MAG TPA: SRPBCC domain-containing protein [Candidatus Acidoferrum sp.]|nr:SRPBCC domain-containing protein [Candidatus Acidoferrum sp.]
MIEFNTACFTLTRTFDAPCDVVFRVFTQPEYVAEWWGCEGSTTVVHTLDVRTGGTYHIDLRLPDGTVYSSRGSYSDVSPCKRMVSSDGVATHTITFEEHDGRTNVELLVTFSSQAAFERAANLGVRAGTARSWDTIERIVLNVNR